jgi:acetyl esterase/lipase
MEEGYVMRLTSKRFTGLLSLTLALLFAFGGMSAAAVARTDLESEYLEYSYGAHGERSLMDIYMPDDINTRENGFFNVMLFLHGGGWTGGDKSQFTGDPAALAQEYAAKGYVCASMNYRFICDDATIYSSDVKIERTDEIEDPLPSGVTHWYNNDDRFYYVYGGEPNPYQYAGNGNTYADMLDDIDSALLAIKNLLEANGCQAGKVAIQGYSAGGYLALLYSYTRAQTAPIEPAFAVSGGGVGTMMVPGYVGGLSQNLCADITNLLGLNSPLTTASFDDEDDLSKIKAGSPMEHVSSAIPTIFYIGLGDTTVPHAVFVDPLYDALEDAGVPVSKKEYAAGHDIFDDTDLMEEFCDLYFPTEPPHEHIYVWLPLDPATCTAAATEIETCEADGTTRDTRTVGNPLGHTYGDWIIDTPATPTAAGARHRVCTVCGLTVNGTIPATGVTQTAKGIFGTNPKWDGQGNHWWHYILFFLCFGFIWMWF